MQPISFIVAALLGLVALAFVLFPLYRRSAMEAQTLALEAETRGLSESEQNARQALQEVEFDFQLGNLEDKDYRSLRTRYLKRALHEMKDRLQREEELDATIEQELQRLKAAEQHEEAGDEQA